jgi:hypothetical protein
MKIYILIIEETEEDENFHFKLKTSDKNKKQIFDDYGKKLLW